MINGRSGKRIAVGIAVLLVGFICLRVLLLVLRQNGAAASLDAIIALLTGGMMGAAGVNPYPAPAAPIVMVHPPETPPPTVVVQTPPAEHPPWLYDPITGDKL